MANISVVTTDTVKTSPNKKIFAAVAFLALLVLSACGGGYQYVKPPTGSQTEPPYEKSFTQVQVFASAGPAIPKGGTVLVSASAVYQISPNSFANTDVTNSATWTTSDATIATVNNGVVTGTGTAPPRSRLPMVASPEALLFLSDSRLTSPSHRRARSVYLHSGDGLLRDRDLRRWQHVGRQWPCHLDGYAGRSHRHLSVPRRTRQARCSGDCHGHRNLGLRRVGLRGGDGSPIGDG